MGLGSLAQRNIERPARAVQDETRAAHVGLGCGKEPSDDELIRIPPGRRAGRREVHVQPIAVVDEPVDVRVDEAQRAVPRNAGGQRGHVVDDRELGIRPGRAQKLQRTEVAPTRRRIDGAPGGKGRV